MQLLTDTHRETAAVYIATNNSIDDYICFYCPHDVRAVRVPGASGLQFRLNNKWGNFW